MSAFPSVLIPYIGVCGTADNSSSPPEACRRAEYIKPADQVYGEFGTGYPSLSADIRILIACQSCPVRRLFFSASELVYYYSSISEAVPSSQQPSLIGPLYYTRTTPLLSTAKPAACSRMPPRAPDMLRKGEWLAFRLAVKEPAGNWLCMACCATSGMACSSSAKM